MSVEVLFYFTCVAGFTQVQSETDHKTGMCVCVCVCVYARACMAEVIMSIWIIPSLVGLKQTGAPSWSYLHTPLQQQQQRFTYLLFLTLPLLLVLLVSITAIKIYHLMP